MDSRLEVFKEPIKVLSHGEIKLIDVMGDDSAIADAARISYRKGTKKVSNNRELIRYLMRHYHLTPFEMCSIKLYMKLPIDVMRQLVRHRTGKINESSSRYSVVLQDTEIANPWRLQSTDNKQGSEGILDPIEATFESGRETWLHDLVREIYDSRLAKGVAREQARKDLLLCTYTEIVWKMDLRNLFNFLKLRLDSHAQFEIRQYAEAIKEIVKIWVPDAYEAFEDYILNAENLSANDVKIIKHLNLFRLNREDWSKETTDKYYEFYSFLTKIGFTNPKNRESKECEAKLLKLGFNKSEFIWNNNGKGNLK